MNEIQKILSQINEVSQRLEQYTSLLREDPNNFSNQITVESIKAQLSDLENQLRIEKMIREKEVIEVRLKGRFADGTIGLDVLSKLADGFSGTILNASSFIQFGQRVKKGRTKEIYDIVDLRLAGISTGSTRLFITANSSPDLFGRSLAEESLKHTFNVLNSDSVDVLTESVAKIGNDSVKKLYKFITSISNADLEVNLDWKSPTNETYEWKADKEELLKVAQSLTNINISEPEVIEFSGELIAISLRNKFEIKTIDGITIRGIYPNELLDLIKTLTIGSNYDGKLEKCTIVNLATETEKIFYTLISINHIL